MRTVPQHKATPDPNPQAHFLSRHGTGHSDRQLSGTANHPDGLHSTVGVRGVENSRLRSGWGEAQHFATFPASCNRMHSEWAALRRRAVKSSLKSSHCQVQRKARRHAVSIHTVRNARRRTAIHRTWAFDESLHAGKACASVKGDLDNPTPAHIYVKLLGRCDPSARSAVPSEAHAQDRVFQATSICCSTRSFEGKRTCSRTQLYEEAVAVSPGSALQPHLEAPLLPTPPRRPLLRIQHIRVPLAQDDAPRRALDEEEGLHARPVPVRAALWVCRLARAGGHRLGEDGRVGRGGGRGGRGGGRRRGREGRRERRERRGGVEAERADKDGMP